MVTDWTLKSRQLDSSSEAMEALLDIFYSVGSFYIQFPSANSNTLSTAFPETEEPTAMIGGTWSQTWGPEGAECNFATEGIFFKTLGDPLSQTDGENNARTTGLQTDQLQKHLHKAPGDVYYLISLPNLGGYSGGASGAGTLTTSGYTADGDYGDPRTGKETRGRNRFIKIWKRTS